MEIVTLRPHVYLDVGRQCNAIVPKRSMRDYLLWLIDNREMNTASSVCDRMVLGDPAGGGPTVHCQRKLICPGEQRTRRDRGESQEKGDMLPERSIEEKSTGGASGNKRKERGLCVPRGVKPRRKGWVRRGWWRKQGEEYARCGLGNEEIEET